MGGINFRVIDGSPKTRECDDIYHSSSLHKWFRLDTWTDKEAICLICGIDPTDAEIDWYGKPKEAELAKHVPIIKQAQLLSEDSSFKEIPREQLNQLEKEMVARIVSLEFPDFTSDQLTPLSKVYEKDIKLENAQSRLQKIWSIFSRADDKGIPFGRERPSWYINWALRRNINVSWLNWAEHNGYLIKESKNTQPDPTILPVTSGKKTPKSKATDRQKEKDKEDAELRDKAKKMAIKMKIEGIDPKYISAKKVCERLLKETFTSGKPFSSRWGTPEGMRSYLKNEHNPTRTTEFRNAKSTRTKFNS